MWLIIRVLVNILLILCAANVLQEVAANMSRQMVSPYEQAATILITAGFFLTLLFIVNHYLPSDRAEST